MGERIKLVQVLLTAGEGGAQTYFEKMVFAFAQEPDIEQRVITVKEPNRLKRFNEAGIKYLPTGALRSDKRPHQFIQSQIRILSDRVRISRYLGQFGPDIILSYHCNAPSVINHPGAIHIARLGHECPMKRYRNCDYLVVNMPSLQHFMVAKGWPKDRIEVISNFAEFPTILQSGGELPHLPDDAKIILTLGRLHPTKAQDTLIEALEFLPGNTHLLIAGEGKLERELKALAERLNLSRRVHFLGLRRDVPRLLLLADVVVLPSRFETLGNVVLEAWHARKPIVAANSAGPGWLIDHEKNGLLFEVDNVADCARQLNRLFAMQPAEINHILDRGTEKLEQQFTRKVIIERYKKLFRRLLHS